MSIVIVASSAKFGKGRASLKHPVLPKNYRLVTICSSSATQLYAVGLCSEFCHSQGAVVLACFHVCTSFLVG